MIYKRAELLAKAEFDVQDERCEVCWKAYSLLDVCLRYLHSFAFESRKLLFLWKYRIRCNSCLCNC